MQLIKYLEKRFLCWRTILTELIDHLLKELFLHLFPIQTTQVPKIQEEKALQRHQTSSQSPFPTKSHKDHIMQKLRGL